MKNIIIAIIALTIILHSCSNNNQFDEQKAQDHLIMATLWYQKSSEMKAIYYQSFNWAKYRLQEKVESDKSDKKKAVVVDIDETMLDNSPFEGKSILTGIAYTKETWKDWCDKVIAEPLPGAVEFSKFAESLGVEVFYISNRSHNFFDVTLKNLQKENFAFADSSHLLLKTDTGSKENRRNKVKENFEIVLLIGDNMGDLAEIFEDRSNNYGFDEVDRNKDLFGDKYIILPNPMYGEWESTVLDYKKDLSEHEKYKFRRTKLESY